MEFTINELKEIEKRFDNIAGIAVNQHINIVSVLSRFKSKKINKHLGKLFDEYVSSFDVFRTISAKASIMIEHKVKK